MTAEASDDVIRIRVDTDAAVREFMNILAAQAAEGETRAPANPANRAVFRELAPYRLLEYEYVDAGIGGRGAPPATTASTASSGMSSEAE